MEHAKASLHELSTSTEWTRELPETYIPTKEPSVDRLAFFHVIERLKGLLNIDPETDWLDKIAGPESIADHMHRMSVLALCTSDTSLDVPKCVMISVVHDLAEAIVGDIAPWEGVSKAEKALREKEGMRSMLSNMLHDSPAAKRIEALWEEYEAQSTPEARFVKDLDRLEMALQASEYEKAHATSSKKLQAFFDSSLPKIQHPEVAQWGKDLADERDRHWTGSKPQ